MHNAGSSYVNLLKTAVCSGILAYPFLFSSYGYVLATIFSSIAATFAFLGLLLYIQINYGHLLEQRETSLNSLAAECFPNFGFIADIVMVLKCLGVVMGYLVIAAALLPRIIDSITGGAFNPPEFVALALFMILTAPFAFFEQITHFRYTSFCGVLCVACVVILAVYNLATGDINVDEVKATGTFSSKWFQNIGKMVFSFSCHQNIFSVHAESTLVYPEVYNISILAAIVLSTALIGYITFGMSNYLIFGSDVEENILEAYPLTKTTIFIKILYIIILGFSYPLQVHPARTSIFQALGLKSDKNDKTDQKKTSVLRFTITVIILIVCYCVAASGIQMGTLFSIIGSTVSIIVCSIFPGLFYINSKSIRKRSLWTFLSYISIMYGVAVFLSSFSIFFGS